MGDNRPKIHTHKLGPEVKKTESGKCYVLKSLGVTSLGARKYLEMDYYIETLPSMEKDGNRVFDISKEQLLHC